MRLKLFSYTVFALCFSASYAVAQKNFTYGSVQANLPLISFNGYQAHSFALFGGAFGCCAGQEGPNNFWFQLGKVKTGNAKTGGTWGAGGSFTLNTNATSGFCPCTYTGTWLDAAVTPSLNPDQTATVRLYGHLVGTLCSDFGCFENVPATYSQDSYEVTTLPATAYGFGSLTATIIPPN